MAKVNTRFPCGFFFFLKMTAEFERQYSMVLEHKTLELYCLGMKYQFFQLTFLLFNLWQPVIYFFICKMGKNKSSTFKNL